MRPKNKIQLQIIIILIFIFLSSCSTEYGIGLPGHLVWKTYLSILGNNESVNSSPAVIGGKVYVGSGFTDGGLAIDSGNINCIDANTGWIIWRKLYSPFQGNADHVSSSPAVVNGRLYLHDGAYNADNGSMLWTQKLETPAVANGCVYTVGPAVYCLDNETGEVKWDTESQGSDNWAIPTVYNGNVYSRNENGKVACFDGTNGDVVWEITIEDDRATSLSASNGFVYFHSFDDEKIRCLNADDGTEVWSFDAGGLSGSKPAIKDGFVYISKDKIYCLNALTGAKVWEYITPSSVYSSPAITEKYVYVSDGDYCLLCLDRETGEKVWSYETEDNVKSSPAVMGGNVYVGSKDGWLYCIKAPEDEDGYWPMYGYNPARTGSADEN